MKHFGVMVLKEMHIGVYRPPDSKQMWIDTFEQQLNIADTHNLDIYTVGDFNIIFSTVTGFQNTKRSNLIADYNLTQLITYPTRDSLKNHPLQ